MRNRQAIPKPMWATTTFAAAEASTCGVCAVCVLPLYAADVGAYPYVVHTRVAVGVGAGGASCMWGSCPRVDYS